MHLKNNKVPEYQNIRNTFTEVNQKVRKQIDLLERDKEQIVNYHTYTELIQQKAIGQQAKSQIGDFQSEVSGDRTRQRTFRQTGKRHGSADHLRGHKSRTS